MAVITRTPLVLRGVSVLCDGLTVVARLGSGYQAAATQTPAPFSMRHPQPFNAGQPQSERWSNPEEHRDASSRTGRSARTTVGVLTRTILGGPFVPAARLAASLAGAVASVDKIDPRTRGRLVSTCPTWQVAKPGFIAGPTTSTESTRWGPAGDRMS